MEQVLLPVAERFHSYQGEGLYTGTPMHFVRLAGCTVGKLPVPTNDEEKHRFPILKTKKPAWRCHTYDGRPFWCDTDFNVREHLTIDEIIKETPEPHLCLTGGEPLAHLEKIRPLLEDTPSKRKFMIHIETSGTILLEHYTRLWVTVSPKLGVLDDMITRADEIKLLVDQDFDLERLPRNVRYHPLVYVQPINGELMLDHENLDHCYRILRMFPKWRLSVQLHKLLGLR